MKLIQWYILIVILFNTSLSGQNLELVPEQSQIKWTGKAAFSNYSLSGTIKIKSCNIIMRNNLIEKIDITIDMNSLDAENEDLKNHLRSKDFFEVENYPAANFRADKVINIESNKYEVMGDMTIKNQTHQEKILPTISKQENYWTIKGEIILDRTKYGIFFNSPNIFKNLKEQAIADEFTLQYSLTFKLVEKVKQKHPDR